jgi:hypothetical protein
MARAFTVEMASEVSVTDSITWEKRREFAERNKLATGALLALTVAGPIIGFFLAGFVGLLIGLVIDLIALFVGDRAVTRVREIERGHG